MASGTEQEKPIALIIEDDAAKLRTRRELFLTGGFQPIEAETAEDAFRQFRSTPTVDIVVADINLDKGDPEDKSGVRVAADIRKQRPELPVVGLSGRVFDLEEGEKKVFSTLVLKGAYSGDAIDRQLADWHAEALQYRRERAQRAKRRLATVHEEQGRPTADVELIRGFLPGTHLSGGDSECSTPDEILRREGWRLRLVEAGLTVRQDDSGGTVTVRTNAAVPFWVREEGDRKKVLLHGHPLICNDADTEERAVEGALTLMYGWYRELAEQAGKRQTGEVGEVEALQKYLRSVFG